MSNFSKNIESYVNEEIILATTAAKQKGLDSSQIEFSHLENAHVLGQESTYHHVKVHYLMLRWGFREKNVKEVLGQLFRVIGAATKTALTLVPKGNTGGSNVSPFKVMSIPDSFEKIIAEAKRP